MQTMEGGGPEFRQGNPVTGEDGITLVAEGRSFHCSKRKLIEASDYFRAMFSNNFKERGKTTIELQDIDADCLQMLLQYVETGTFVVSPDSILALLQTAAMLQFGRVQKECEQQVLASLSCDACLEVYLVTTTLGLQNIATAALTMAVWNFPEICKKPQFHQLAINELIDYISNPALYPGPEGEWAVWEAVVSWIEDNEVEKSPFLMQLLLCLDFQALTVQDISNMLFYPCVSENIEAVQLLEGLQTLKKERGTEISYFSSETNKILQQAAKEAAVAAEAGEQRPRQSREIRINKDTMRTVESILDRPRRSPPQVPCVVGFKRSSAAMRKKKKAKNSDNEEEEEYDITSSRVRNAELIPVIYSFNPTTNKMMEELALSKLCEGPVHCSGYQVCSLGPSIYIFGGEYLFGNGNWNKSVWRYSTASRKWIIENSLPQPRRHQMICVVDSVIYLLGGYGKYRVVQSSVDAYDTTSGEWLRCPDMPHCVSHGAVCNFKGRLMVFTQEMQLLTYYPKMKKWSAIPVRSPNKQGYRAALTWENAVYLIDNCSPKVYQYLPEGGHTISYFGHFTTPPVNVCMVDGIIYSFSHDDLDDSHVIEVLDVTEACPNATKTKSDNSKQGMEMEDASRQRQKSESSERSDSVVSRKEDESSGGKKGQERSESDSSSSSSSSFRASKEIWREKETGPFIFTTKCPADTTFSLGCFPLLKLK